MYKYVKQIDFDFVRDFGNALGLENFHVRCEADGWHINFDDDKQTKNNILLTDFVVESVLGSDFCKKATKLWNIELYAKFGKSYLKDLQEFKINKLTINYNNQKQIVKEEMKNIERGL